METLEAILAAHPFFEGLEKRHLEVIVGCASNVRFDPGAFVAREGQEAKQFYLIRQGKVALQIFAPNRGAITFETLEEGEILGWSWLVPPYSWRFDARAVDLTRAIALDGECLRAKCEKDHDLGYELLLRFSQVIALRLEAARLQLLDVYAPHK